MSVLLFGHSFLEQEVAMQSLKKVDMWINAVIIEFSVSSLQSIKLKTGKGVTGLIHV